MKSSSKTLFSCDIVLLPEPELDSKILSFAQSFKEFNNYFFLEKGIFYPHVSLFMVQIDYSNLDPLISKLKNTADEFSRLNMTGTSFGETRGYIEVGYKKSNDVLAMQSKVIEVSNAYRHGIRESEIELINSSEGVARSNFEKFGYKYVDELFRPHITFARLKDVEFDLGTIAEKPAEFSGKFVSLGIFELGKHGTCVKPITTFNFK